MWLASFMAFCAACGVIGTTLGAGAGAEAVGEAGPMVTAAEEPAKVLPISVLENR